jgi:hypothetical protein
MSAALVSAPVALGKVDGDPIATKVFKFKLAGAFKKQLKQNGVKMKPKKVKLTKGDVDPTTGKTDVTLGKITFKKGNKKVVYKNLTGSMPGTVKSVQDKLFRFSAPKVTRDGFGADLSGIKVKFLKSAAKEINRGLDLDSLHKSSAGKVSLSYEPKTVKIVSGSAVVSVPLSDLSTGANTSITGKVDGHCINVAGGVSPIAPATLALFPPSPPGTLANFTFPVTGGTISPDGKGGIVHQAGGVMLQNNLPPSGTNNCPGPPATTTLSQTDFNVNLGANNVQAIITIGGTNPPLFLGGAGNKGPAIGQVIDPTNVTVQADPANHTIKVAGGVIKNNATATLTLNTLFPRSPDEPAIRDFADGDSFGSSTLTVQVR